MKSKDFRGTDSGDSMRRAAKLEPIRKSGKEKHTILKATNDNEEGEDLDYKPARESVFDYMDDEEEDER